MRAIDYFDRATTLYPDRAFVCQGEVARRYADSWEATHRIAAALQRDGLAADEPVSFYMPNDWRGVEALYGTFRAGNPTAPVNNRNSVAQNVSYAQAAGSRALFFHSQYRVEVEALLAQCPDLRLVVCLDSADCGHPALENWMEPVGARACERPFQPLDCWSLVGTSGTTGEPKCVVQTHLTIASATQDFLFATRVQEPVRNLVVGPISHMAGYVLYGMTAVGSTHYLHNKIDVLEIMRTIDRERIEIIFLPPTVIYMMLEHPDVRRFDFSSLKAMIYAGAPMARTKVRDAIGIFGPVMMNIYGQTETSAPVTFLRPEDHRPGAGPEWEWRLQSIGRASLTRQVEIMDEEGRILGPHQPGEVVVRGCGNALGYWNNPAATEELLRFGWLHTGDIGVKDEENYIVLVDRKKDMIVTGGLNVFSGEVEHVLMSHSAVLIAVVIGVPDPKWGEAVKAIVELKPGRTVSESELIALCKRELGGVKAPKSVEFRDELPRSSTGKILKRDIRRDYWVGQERNI
jgi:acyl-CoA synthetase (AMP-forming)/AMP-acid ligase II